VSDKNTDPQQDHTYDAAEFHNQTSNNEQPHYNTLQRDNAANIPIWSNSSTILFDTYEKIGADNTTINDAHNRFKLGQLRGTHTNDSASEYDVVENTHTQNVLNQPPIGVNETNQMIPRDYELVYFNNTQVDFKELAGKHNVMLFDDETYGRQKPAPRRVAVQLRVDGVEAKPNCNPETEKEETSRANKEVQYAEPLVPNYKSHIQDVQAEGEHFYHSLELNEPTKCISGDPYSKEYSNPVVMKERTFGSNSDLTSKAKSSKLATLPIRDQVTADAKSQAHIFMTHYDTCSDNTMGEAGAANAPIQCEFDDPMYEGIPHSAPKRANNKNPTLSKVHIEIPEEASRIGGVNAHPDFLMDREEDTNTPRYSDPGCLDDTNMANGQEDTIVNIYDTSDDPIF
jgi:hypothetical protein